MAKRRRSHPHRPAKQTAGAAGSSLTGEVPTRIPIPSKTIVAEARPKRTSYLEALAQYERGVQALQGKNYRLAADLLQSVLDRYPDERELHERVRLYLKVCERQTGTPPPSPRTAEERLYAATLALNAGGYDEALAHLQAVDTDDPANDHAQYMLAVVNALQGRPERALAHLRRAIDLNPENRAFARQDPDLDPLRGHEAFRLAVETGTAGAARRRARGRAR